jgi:hypothetical protein
MRTITVIYGNPNEPNAMLKYGGDTYIETAPGKWSRWCDLPQNHPANFAKLQAATFFLDGDIVLDALDARDPEHRALAAKEGLRIPFGENDPVSIIGPASTVPDTTPSSERYNELVQKVLELMKRLDDVQQMDKETLLQRLDNLKKQLSKQRIAELQDKLSKLAEDEKFIEAQRTPKDANDFIQASIREILGTGKMFTQTKAPYLARQLETLFREYSVVDFKGYFEDPRKMERLRALSWL